VERSFSGRTELSLRTQADLLSLNRSGLYYEPLPPSAEEIAVKHWIDEIYTKHPFYGSRKITVVLNEKIVINRKTVQRHMREMGIAGICPGPNLSKRRLEHQIYPYLLRDITASYPNHVWGIDITYIRLRGGWMYLVAVLDWYSRYVVSWEMDQTLEMPFAIGPSEKDGKSLGRWQAGNLEQRPRKPFHQSTVHSVAGRGCGTNQHGWERTSYRQYLRGTTLAIGQVRGGLPQGLRIAERSAPEPW
jgi:putative transposase